MGGGGGETHEDGGVGELGDELGDAEAAGSGAGDVEGEGEGGEDDLDGELGDVDQLLAVAGGEGLVLRVRELLHALDQPVRSSRHGGEEERSEFRWYYWRGESSEEKKEGEEDKRVLSSILNCF